MKILHIGLLSHFTEGMLYQDNVLSDMNAKAGHEVTFITDTYCYKSGKLVQVPETDYVMENGVRLIRLCYDKIVNQFVSSKIQKVKKLSPLLESIAPDTILYHGACGYELMDVARYVESHPETLFYIDSHEDFHNTARNFISKCAYKYIHGIFLRKAIPVAKKVLFLSLETKEYLQTMYCLSDEILEFFPLGGIILSQEERETARKKLITNYRLREDTIICTHSGKLIKEKRTIDLLEVFENIRDERLQLFIFGSIPENRKSKLMPLIERDERIHFLGWKNEKEMLSILAGTDLYCQPGTQSATFQVALCCGCATMVYPYSSYKVVLKDNGYYAANMTDIRTVLEKITEVPEELENMKKKSIKVAGEYLDYKKIAARICR